MEGDVTILHTQSVKLLHMSLAQHGQHISHLFQLCQLTGVDCNVQHDVDRAGPGLPGLFDVGTCSICYLDELGYGRCWSPLVDRSN